MELNIEQTESRKVNRDEISMNQEKSRKPPTKKLCSKKCGLITIIISIVVFVIIVGVVAYFFLKNSKGEIETEKENGGGEIEKINDLIDVNKKIGPKEKEFDIVTRPGDLKQISVVQKSEDETIINNYRIKTEYIRKTSYDIFILSEEDPEEKLSSYFTKMYQGSVSIRSECSSTEEDCQPQQLMDLTLNPVKEDNARALEEDDTEKIENYENYPIPLCLFNMTDNHIITSIKCHKSFPEEQKNQILLDLYFFRPPASQRIDKQNDNITLNIYENKKTKERYIRETNGGNCNIYNNLGSLCTTDMNTTLDSDKNLISYDEEAITMINYDENNSYKKKKITHLKDVSNNIKKEDVKNYQYSLNILKPLIENYMKEDIQFTDDDFVDFSDRYRNDSKRYIPKKTRNVFRQLDQPENKYNQMVELFSQKAKGLDANIKLEINPGINSDIVGAYGTFNLDKEKYIYSSIQNISTINELINRVASVSKAGNQLASELYDKIIEKLEQVLNDITIQLNELSSLVLYQDLYPIFSSTLSLYAYNKFPNDILKVSNDLLNGLSQILSRIKLDNVSIYAKIIHDDVYNYIDEINTLIINMMNNFSNLTETLIQKNNTYIAITNYYLNDTSASYFNLIDNMRTILNNFFIDEYNLIFPKIENLLHTFDEKTRETLKKDLSSLKELYNNLLNESYTINNITTQDYNKVLSNLNNSVYYPNNIVNKINEFILEKLNIKQNGYFMSKEDINKLNNTYNSIFLKAEEVAEKFGDFQLIDKVFDEIMIKFRDDFIYTVSYMEKIKSKNFVLEEDVLNMSSFSQSIKNKLEEEIKIITQEIFDAIKISNNYEKIKNYLISFLEEKNDYINNLISDLDLIFSEEKLNALSLAFEISLNLSLQKITNETNNNIFLAKSYYDEYFEAINDLSGLKKLVQKQMIKNPGHPDYKTSTIYQMIEYDQIEEKEYTSAYIAKYNSFMANLNYSQEYLMNHLYIDIINEQRQIFDKIKGYFVSILKNELGEILSDFDEINFFKNHFKIIEKLITRLYKYFAQDVFDKKYLKIINESINMNKQKIEETKEYINSKHNFIKTLHYYSKDYSNDICITFRRKVCYGCTNCVSFTFFFDRVCFVLSPYQYNYLEVKKINFDSMKILNNFENIFVIFDSLLNIKVETYISIINNLTANINSLTDNSNEEGTNRNISISFFSPIKKWINKTLYEKYQDEIIKSVYNYYQNNINEKMEIILDDIFNKWKEIYLNLKSNVEKNKDNIKYSLFEFSMIGSIYKSIISQELTENYFDSIVLFQRSEFNYTISYYYNYLIKLVDKSYKDILNKIQIREYAFNDTMQDKKSQIKNIYDILIQDIENSVIKYSKIENQLNILQVNDSDFFIVKHIMEKNIEETDKKLENMIYDIFEQEYDLDGGDSYSLAMRYYLENKELGKLIQVYYEPIDNEELIYLDLDKFKDILKENFVLDEGDFIYILNKALFETNRIIKKELSIKVENYSAIIENEITKFFEDEIENIIDELYSNQFEKFTNSIGNEIYNNIFEIVNKIIERITYERKRIEANLGNYNLNAEKIIGIIDNYKKIINDRLNNSIFAVLDLYHENINNNIYSNCIETRLYILLNETKKISSLSDFGEYEFVNSSYNIGEVIYNLAKTVSDNYQENVKKKINYKYNEYFEKINNNLSIPLINQTVDNLLSLQVKDELYYYLYVYPTCNSANCQEFDFSYETMKGINDTIDKKMNNITNLINSIKGNNYEVNFECALDFVNSGENIIKPICESFKKFLSFENKEQAALIDEFIKNYISSNLDDFLYNEIPNFGNSFFERIIDYNINLKIADLYHNLRYSLAQTILYYKILDEAEDVGELPSDLKIRLIQLNDLDLTIKIKKEEIKKLLDRKLYELIDDLKDTAKEAYNHNLRENEIIKNNFSPHFLEIIGYNLEEIMSDLDKKYQNVLEIYLKEKFTTSFADILEIETEKMLKVFYAEKNELIKRFDVLFSSKEDKALHEINIKINNSLESIQIYNNFIDTFEIKKSVIDFFYEYGNSTLVPLFLKFDQDLNSKTKQLIMNEINKKSSTIEKLSANTISNKLSSIDGYYLTKYYNFVGEELTKYGKVDISYESNLNYTRDKIYKRLIDNLDEDDSIEETKKRIESKDVEETLNILLNRAYNNYNGFSNLDIFIYFKNRINNYKNNVNIETKNIKEMININKYNDEITSFLLGKVNSLSTFLINYFNQIDNKFNNYKNLWMGDWSSISSIINTCTSVTRRILNNEYQKIFREIKPINYKYTNNIKNFNLQNEYEGKSDHMSNNASVNIFNVGEYAEFKLDLILEGYNFIRPKVKGRIVDKSKPEKVDIELYSKCGRCCKNGQIYNITLNDVNLTTTIEYDTITSSINITTYANIEKYYFKEIVYRKEQKEIVKNVTFDTIVTPFISCSKDKNNNIYLENVTEISAQHFNDTIIVTK